MSTLQTELYPLPAVAASLTTSLLVLLLLFNFFFNFFSSVHVLSLFSPVCHTCFFPHCFIIHLCCLQPPAQSLKCMGNELCIQKYIDIHKHTSLCVYIDLYTQTTLGKLLFKGGKKISFSVEKLLAKWTHFYKHGRGRWNIFRYIY